MKVFCLSMVVVAALLITGCSQKVVQPTQGPVTPTISDRSLSTGDASDGSKSRSGISEEELAQAERRRAALRESEAKAQAGLFSPISFEFDSYVVASSELPKIETVGNWMKQNRSAKVTVQGHCDERGTVEYNLALGQRRADAVKDHLVKMGIDSARIKAVSFGKETPEDPGHTEDAWARNRRAVVKIDQKG